MSFTLTGTNLDAPDAAALAGFYRRLLGWTVEVEQPGWVVLRPPGGGHTLNFQTEPHYVRPAWPPRPGEPQMMMHLEIRVDDLSAAMTRAVELGATLADFQPQADIRVCLDPAGHRFCLYTGGQALPKAASRPYLAPQQARLALLAWPQRNPVARSWLICHAVQNGDVGCGSA